MLSISVGGIVPHYPSLSTAATT